MSRNSILIVHPDPSIRGLIASMLKTLGHRIDEADCDRTAVRQVEAAPPSLVLAWVDPGDVDAMEMLDYMRRKHPAVPTILLFAEPHPERAREAIKRGAASVLRYPAAANSLRAAVSQAIEERGRPAEIHNLNLNLARVRPAEAHPPGDAHPIGNGRHGSNGQSANGHRGNGHAPILAPEGPPVSDGSRPASFVGNDAALREAVGIAGSIASSRVPVLIVGDRGTGKSLMARAIHAQGPRAEAPFVEVSCSTTAEASMEAELFGQVGIDGLVPGKIAQAHGGTLYLDEIASLSPGLQLRLLKWVQDGQIVPRGGDRPIRVDVRLITSSREDLAGLAEEGMLRQDLYHRIGVVSLRLPPLRHRGSDVELLAEHFLAKYASEVGKSVSGFSAEALEAIRSYAWPGNVLELENAVERGVVLCRGGRIEAGHLALPRKSAAPKANDRETAHTMPSASGILPLKEALEAPEKLLILQALEALNWNRQETARVLDINRTTLYKKMKKYGLLVEEPAWVH